MDYAHARHAGNAGDVFKHVALLAVLQELKPASYVETHAGDGLYPLGSAGEWGDGIQRLWNYSEGGLVGRYVDLARSFSQPGAARPEAYPGSPLLASRFVEKQLLYEIDRQAASVLRRALPNADVRVEDGLAPLAPADLVLIDPPYAQKQEWTDAARAAARIPDTPLLLWYPIKALTRPRALISELARLGIHGTAVELHWTPLRLKRERLNGSGLVFSHIPKRAVSAVCAVLPDLGPALQTHGEWGSVVIGF
ncbi:MAG: 23S rRNA (adenine(2030)-N(6))-methyltransferase RlmJ [Myxococcales bacterium]